MADKFAVIGLGQFGSAICRKLSEKGAEVIAIDIDEDKVEAIKEYVAYAVVIDSTDSRALRSQNISEMDAVVVSIGQNFEGMLLTTVKLLEMGRSQENRRNKNRRAAPTSLLRLQTKTRQH